MKEFKERTDEVLEDARYEPVALTEKGEGQFVVMSAELFKTVYAGSRRAGFTDELTDEQLGIGPAAPVPEGRGQLEDKRGGKE